MVEPEVNIFFVRHTSYICIDDLGKGQSFKGFHWCLKVNQWKLMSGFLLRGILSSYMLSKRQASAYMIDIDMR